MISERRVPALDGVRGLAILAVFVYHATNWGGGAIARWGSWGWMGVDLFFVLSGYLITGILLDTRQRHDYYSVFYVKRALRILPAFVAFMLVLAFLAPMRPTEHQLFVGHQGWYWGYAANVLLARQGWSALPFETGHLWSLAVEEQFYFVWPFVIARCTRPRFAFRVALGVIVCVGVLRALAVMRHADALPIYVLPMFRADALAWGALLAALERRRSNTISVAQLRPMLLVLGGLVLAVVIARLRDANNPSPSMQLLGYPALAAFGAGLVATAITSAPRWLAWRPLRLIGRYSYGFYLWHAPVLLVATRVWAHAPWLAFALAGFVATMAITLASWTLIERPALSLKHIVDRHQVPEGASLT